MADRRELEQNLCWEIGIVQQPKNGEIICGDTVSVTQNRDQVRIVLSDGLGSGVQANIASTLTASLISSLTQNAFPIEDCIRAVEAVLPVTRKHGLAYATFSLAETSGREVHLIQFDNPPAVFLRDGVSLVYPGEAFTVGEKTLLESTLTMKSGDMLVLFSDGISEAGRGVTTYSGWNRREMEDYLLRSVGPDDHARQVAAGIVSAAQALDLYEFHDDTTVIVLRLRERLTVNLQIDPLDDIQSIDDVVMSTDTVPEEINASVQGGQELQRLVDQLERYLRNGMMSLGIKQEADGTSELADLLAEQASDVNILFRSGTESDRPQTPNHIRGGCLIPEAVLQLQQLLTDAGKAVTLCVC
ncbi:MAG: serine/threonine-protein phosphatase [Oscillospiraceae bacterium]|nr:serine/threonine-protein phosphatase [Oscillospiraceae bacterium]